MAISVRLPSKQSFRASAGVKVTTTGRAVLYLMSTRIAAKSKLASGITSLQKRSQSLMQVRDDNSLEIKTDACSGAFGCPLYASQGPDSSSS